ncbi:glycosyltransferase [Sulfitobacter aestuariivivens]|uniref:glycosyltransferase n=1 Tax=Sulfitobacter aestuariivivens TaxID=2766981 RepID=UPI00361E4718
MIGFLGAWRYSWAAINFTRALWFKRLVYPRWRKRRDERFAQSRAKHHCYFMVTTYMVDPDITLPVYRSIFKAAMAARDGATIVASVVDGMDDRLIKGIYRAMDVDPNHVELVIDRIKSDGKRDAMQKALRILASFSPTHNDIMVFVDGDTIVPEDIWARSAPVFTDPRTGALTTDEAAIIGPEGLFKDWFRLRFNQRQVMMCSMGLSNRVLTLTGRMSVFRADLSTDPTFVRAVGQDYLDHWRLGRVNFLTGDDKSTWYWLLTHGYETAYLPDVQSASYEGQPRDTFFDSAKTLMVRWFGNMMRTNGRAIRLGPKDIGFFTWWSILDQRVSCWTTLVGPISVIITAIVATPIVIPLYLAWVMMTRYIFCVYIALFNREWFPITHPFVLYFGQITGAMIKTFVLFRLDRQKWTRQGGGGGAKVVAFYDRLKMMESTAHHALAYAWLTIAIMFLNTLE